MKKEQNGNIVQMERKSKNKFQEKMGEYFLYYKTNIKRKHLIVYIVSLLILFLMLNLFLSRTDVNTSMKVATEGGTQVVQTMSWTQIGSALLKDKIPTVFLCVFAGITPFVYLSGIAFLYPYLLASNIATVYASSMQVGSIIVIVIGCIIQLIGISLAMATGFYYCSLSSKKFRYSQGKSFGSFNVKRQYYEMRREEEKLNALLEKEKAKQEKNEKLNVKVPYLNMAISFVISTIIVVIGTIIAAI